MTDFMLQLMTGLKNLLRDKLNLIVILLIANLICNGYYYHKINTNIDKSTVDINRKVDHRYFNITKSLEQIHNVEINTFNGELKPKFKY